MLDTARELIAAHRLRSLDAIHLAVALVDGTHLAHPEPLVLVTRDERQREAAIAAGLTVD